MKSFLLLVIYRFFYACASSIDARVEAGSSLIIAPHPDDETLGCGSLISRAVKAGQIVNVLIVTDGSSAGSSSKISTSELASLRRNEAIQAVQRLGLNRNDIHFLDFPDSHTSEHIEEIEDALARHIIDFKPQQVFSPYGIDMNPDHQNTAKAIDNLNKKGLLSCPVYEYPVWFPAKAVLWHMINPCLLKRLRSHKSEPFENAKRAAIEAHKSQCVNMTGEETWFTLTPQFIARFFYGFELFFEKPINVPPVKAS